MQIVHLIPILFIFFLFSCTRDKVNPVECFDIITYEDHVKTIIDTNCAYSGCHVDGFPSGDFTSFSGLEPQLNASAFETEVLSGDMPPSYAPVNTELDSQDIFTIQCWIQNGYLEKN